MTDRELHAISDQMIGHLSLIEKYSLYSQVVQDPEVKQLLQNHQNLLQGHLQTLRSFIQQPVSYTAQPATFQAGVFPTTYVPQGFNQPGMAGRGGFNAV